MMSKILVVEDEHAIRLALRGPPYPWPARCLQLTDDDDSIPREEQVGKKPTVTHAAQLFDSASGEDDGAMDIDTADETNISEDDVLDKRSPDPIASLEAIVPDSLDLLVSALHQAKHR